MISAGPLGEEVIGCDNNIYGAMTSVSKRTRGREDETIELSANLDMVKRRWGAHTKFAISRSEDPMLSPQSDHWSLVDRVVHRVAKTEEKSGSAAEAYRVVRFHRSSRGILT